jgi:hypothetical protein
LSSVTISARSSAHWSSSVIDGRASTPSGPCLRPSGLRAQHPPARSAVDPDGSSPAPGIGARFPATCHCVAWRAEPTRQARPGMPSNDVGKERQQYNDCYRHSQNPHRPCPRAAFPVDGRATNAAPGSSESYNPIWGGPMRAWVAWGTIRISSARSPARQLNSSSLMLLH